VLPSFKIRRTHLCPPRRAQPPHRSWIELSATLNFMLATLVANGAFRQLVKVRCWREAVIRPDEGTKSPIASFTVRRSLPIYPD